MKLPLLDSDVENHVEPFEKFEGSSRSFAAGLRAVWKTGGESAERLQAIVDAQSTQGLTISI
jgi:hypothetical protein